MNALLYRNQVTEALGRAICPREEHLVESARQADISPYQVVQDIIRIATTPAPTPRDPARPSRRRSGPPLVPLGELKGRIGALAEVQAMLVGHAFAADIQRQVDATMAAARDALDGKRYLP